MTKYRWLYIIRLFRAQSARTRHGSLVGAPPLRRRVASRTRDQKCSSSRVTESFSIPCSCCCSPIFSHLSSRASYRMHATMIVEESAHLFDSEETDSMSWDEELFGLQSDSSVSVRIGLDQLLPIDVAHRFTVDVPQTVLGANSNEIKRQMHRNKVECFEIPALSCRSGGTSFLVNCYSSSLPSIAFTRLEELLRFSSEYAEECVSNLFPLP